MRNGAGLSILFTGTFSSEGVMVLTDVWLQNVTNVTKDLDFYFYIYLILRQSLAVQSGLCLNSRSSCLSLLRAEIIGMYYYTWLEESFQLMWLLNELKLN